MYIRYSASSICYLLKKAGRPKIEDGSSQQSKVSHEICWILSFNGIITDIPIIFLSR